MATSTRPSCPYCKRPFFPNGKSVINRNGTDVHASCLDSERTRVDAAITDEETAYKTLQRDLQAAPANGKVRADLDASAKRLHALKLQKKDLE